MSDTSWVEKHRPETFDDIQGNTSALDDIQKWAEDFEPGDEPVLLVGDQGTGKTSTAYVLAEKYGLDLNEINTSEARRTEDVKRIAQQMRAGGDQLVLLDETDSWHHSVKLDPLREALKAPPNRVIMTANNEYDVPYALKEPAEVYEFSLSVSSRRAKLKEVAKAEGVPLDKEDLEALASRPDLRSAINDLQLHAEMGIPIGSDSREWEESEFAVMDRMLQNEEPDSGDVSPPWLVMWLDQNARKEFRGVEAGVAYDTLSRADRHLGSAGPGDYRGWRYAGTLAEHVALMRLSEPYQGFIKWDFPEWAQSKEPDPYSDTPEATLYQTLKKLNEPEYSMSGDFAHFRAVTLPILQRLPMHERFYLVLNNGISEEGMKALNVDPESYKAWAVEREPEAGESLDKPTGDATEADW